MPSHDPLLSDRTEDEDADADVDMAAVVEDSPQKNANIVLITTSASTVAHPDTSLSIVPHYQILDQVPVSDHKAADLPSDKSTPFQKKGWRNYCLKTKVNLILPLSTNLNHWSNSI